MQLPHIEHKRLVHTTHCLSSMAYSAYELHHGSNLVFLCIVAALFLHELIELFLSGH